MLPPMLSLFIALHVLHLHMICDDAILFRLPVSLDFCLTLTSDVQDLKKLGRLCLARLPYTVTHAFNTG